MVIEIQNVPDPVVELLASDIFQMSEIKSPLDRSLRADLLQELRRRKAIFSPDANTKRQNELFVEGREIVLAWIPELRPFESLAAAFSLVDKMRKADRAAVGAFASGRRDVYETFIGCADFLTTVSLKLQEQTNRTLQREKRKWN